MLFSWLSSNSSLIDTVKSYNSYLPNSIHDFLNKTIQDGRDVLYDIYDDVNEEVVDKTSMNIKSLTEVFDGIFSRLKDVSNSINDISKVQHKVRLEFCSEFLRY